MPRIYGHKSEYLVENKTKYRKHAFVLLVLSFLLLTIYLFFLPNHKKIGLTFFAVIFFLCLIVLRIANQMLDKSYNFRSGIKGESSIFFILSQLPNEYVIFQDVTIPGKKDNIDFVIVGPTGIFTVEVKNHSGNISFNGNKLTRDKFPLDQDFLTQAMFEALGLHNYLKIKLEQDIFVQPVLVFSNQHVMLNFNQGSINNVYVLTGNDLISYITNQTPRLNIELISKIENILNNSNL